LATYSKVHCDSVFLTRRRQPGARPLPRKLERERDRGSDRIAAQRGSCRVQRLSRPPRLARRHNSFRLHAQRGIVRSPCSPSVNQLCPEGPSSFFPACSNVLQARGCTRPTLYPGCQRPKRFVTGGRVEGGRDTSAMSAFICPRECRELVEVISLQVHASMCADFWWSDGVDPVYPSE